ncbi:MAG: ABC transporter permease, partial [Pseudomonadota bacterium]
MSSVADIEPPKKLALQERLFTWVNNIAAFLGLIGLGWMVPILRMLIGDNVRLQLRELWQLAVVPLMGIAVFLLAWASFAPMVKTSLGAIPGPAKVWEETVNLYEDHKAERA